MCSGQSEQKCSIGQTYLGVVDSINVSNRETTTIPTDTSLVNTSKVESNIHTCKHRFRLACSSMMSNETVRSYISNAFEPYTKTPEQLSKIRAEIAKHVQSLSLQEQNESDSTELVVIPAYIKGTRRRYLQALHDNTVAKRQYAKLQTDIKSHVRLSHDQPDTGQDIQAHLELLKLRKRSEKLQIISHYAAEAEKLAEQNRVYQTQPIAEQSYVKASTNETVDDSLLLAQARELTRNLEIALLQANHQLQRERQLLEEIKQSRSRQATPTPEAKLHALIATSTELTKWIEDSLAKCDIEHGGNDSNLDFGGQDDRERSDYNQKIDKQYQEYLSARARLLEAASALSAPLPTEPFEPASKDLPSQNAPPIEQQDNESTLPYLSSRHLPLLTQQQTLVQSQTHLNNILSRHNHELREQLLRLSDESHLLPSYPILSKAQNVDRSGDKVDSLLESWKFAIEAAGTATAATAEKQVRIGTGAIEEADAMLQGQEEMSRLWKKLQAE